MKILIVAAAFPPNTLGGAEISTQILAKALSGQDCHVKVLTIGDQAAVSQDGDIDVRRIQSPNLYWSIKEKPSATKKIFWHINENYNPMIEVKLQAILREEQPDLVITSTNDNFGANIWRACNRLDIPVTHILRNYNVMCIRAALHKNGHNCQTQCMECKVMTAGKKQASAHVDGVIGLSRYILDKHTEMGYFAESAKIVLPNFIPATDMIDPAHTRTSWRKARPVIGFLGRMSDYKGVGLLAKAHKATFPSTQAELVIAGSSDPDYLADISKILDGTRHEIIGWAKTSDILDRIDYLCIPSIWYEPLGRVVLEAFAKGIPVIGSNRGGIPEMISNGVDGFVFDPDQGGALEAILEHIAKTPDDYAALCAGALAKAQNYSESALLPQYREFFSRLVSKNPSKDSRPKSI